MLSVTLLPAQDIVEGGSPLYQIAVHEALEGLRGRDQAGREAATPTPCPKCGNVHAAAGTGTNAVAPVAVQAPAAGPQAPAGTGVPCPVCGKVHVSPPSAVSAQRGVNLAAGVRGADAVPTPGGTALDGDLYYCERCKTYHRRKAVVPQ